MLTPPERVAELEKAFYRYSHDRERMAGLLMRVADFVLLPHERPSVELARWHWLDNQRCARYIRQLAQELLEVDP